MIATSGDAEYCRGGRADLRRPVRRLAQGARDGQIQRRHQGGQQAELDSYTGRAKESADYLILAQRLQDLQILKATVTGNFRVLVPATVPTAPISPKPLRSAILGFGVGLFAGIGLAFLLEQFDTRVRRPDDVAALLRQPVLARVPRLSREQTKSPKLVTLEHPADPVAESFRLLRTNLAFMDVDGTAKSLLVTSSLQGEGKSVTVANLAVTLALAGKKVIVVDADLRRPRQHKLFGLENEVGASNVAVGDADLVATLQPVQVVSPDGNGCTGRLHQLGVRAPAPSRGSGCSRAAPSRPTPARSSPRSGSLRCSAGFATSATCSSSTRPAMLAVGDTAALASEVDGLIFLVDMEKARRPVIQAAADQLYRLPCAMMGIVVRSPAGSSRDKYYYTSHYRYSADAKPAAPAAGKGAAPSPGQPS